MTKQSPSYIQATMQQDLSQQKEILVRHALELGVTQIGFANVSFVDHHLTKKLPCAISLIAKFDEKTLGSDESYRNGYIERRNFLEDVKLKLGKLLNDCGHEWLSIGNTENKETLIGEFSHKLTAVSAGLGWIGKSSLFVSSDYGPRVRLSTILTNAIFSNSTQIIKGKCHNCGKCVLACPSKAIKGNEWNLNSKREDLIDVKACQVYREEIAKKIEKKYSCARCVYACPVGGI